MTRRITRGNGEGLHRLDEGFLGSARFVQEDGQFPPRPRIRRKDRNELARHSESFLRLDVAQPGEADFGESGVVGKTFTSLLEMDAGGRLANEEGKVMGDRAVTIDRERLTLEDSLPRRKGVSGLAEALMQSCEGAEPHPVVTAALSLGEVPASALDETVANREARRVDEQITVVGTPLDRLIEQAKRLFSAGEMVETIRESDGRCSRSIAIVGEAPPQPIEDFAVTSVVSRGKEPRSRITLVLVGTRRRKSVIVEEIRISRLAPEEIGQFDDDGRIGGKDPMSATQESLSIPG